MHDPRVGRFFAVDPLAPSYPWNSPYSFSENVVISHVELEGMEKEFYMDAMDRATEKAKTKTHGDIQLSVLETIHVAMDVLGCVPVVGEVFDGINGLIYAFEGDATNSLISFAAIIPIVGDLGKITKYSVKIGKSAKTSSRVFKSAKRAKQFVEDAALYGVEAANQLWSSHKLRGALKGTLKAGEEAHHLIPVNLAKNDVVQDAIEGGYNLNAKGNGIGLSSVKNGGVHAKHGKYTKQVEKKINDWADANEGYTREMAKEYMDDLQQDLYKQVKSKSKNTGTKVNEIKLD